MSTSDSSSSRHAWVVTGPTSGIGHRTALELAKHGTVILVGRSQSKLDAVKNEIDALPGGSALSVVADMSDVRSARRAAAEITGLNLPIGGVLNNAGIFPTTTTKPSRQGFDLAYATNHLGPFAFTDALIPHLADGTNVVFITSAVEDPERKIAARAGFRGGRHQTVAQSARGEWKPDGSTHAGYDAYATSKQGSLATAFAFAREFPRLRFRVIEPGLNAGTSLSADTRPVLQALAKAIITPLAPFVRYLSTPKRSSRMIARVVTDPSDASGVYYDEDGKPMAASAQVSDPAFQDRYVAETRELLATIPAD